MSVGLHRVACICCLTCVACVLHVLVVVLHVVLHVVTCSLRVEGTLPGFDVKISDVKLASLLKVCVCVLLLQLLPRPSGLYASPAQCHVYPWYPAQCHAYPW